MLKTKRKRGRKAWCVWTGGGDPHRADDPKNWKNGRVPFDGCSVRVPDNAIVPPLDLSRFTIDTVILGCRATLGMATPHLTADWITWSRQPSA